MRRQALKVLLDNGGLNVAEWYASVPGLSSALVAGLERDGLVCFARSYGLLVALLTAKGMNAVS